MTFRPHWALVCALAFAACAPPIAVKRLSPETAQRAQTANVLSTGKASDFSLIELRRYDLLATFDADPPAAIAALHRRVREGTARSEELFALAELSFLHAKQGGGWPYYLASAIYAYSLIFGEVDEGGTLSPLDPRQRWAADIYNSALAQAFMRADGQTIGYAAGPYDLPFGKIEIDVDDSQIRRAFWEIRKLTPSADVAIYGLRNRYRRVGIGTPLAGRVKVLDEKMPGAKYASKAAHVPVTMLLRLDKPRAQLRGTELTGHLELFPFSDVSTVDIGGASIPLESEPSVALAETLVASKFWTRELSQFLGQAIGQSVKVQLTVLEPYRKGRIPVVFVHGTGSSSARWADMANDLLADPRIHDDYHFWFYDYDSGNPIAYSAYNLRKTVQGFVGFLDPDGSNPCLHHVVLIGHSQGGLLVKMMVIDSGDSFWRNVTSKPFEEVEMTDEQRELARGALFVKPLPFVDRVVFIATPHRGSYLAGTDFVRRLVQRLITLPVDLLSLGAVFASAAVTGDTAGATAVGPEISTAVDNMSPNHRFIKAIAQVPVADGVHVNSIIPVKGDGPVEEGNDGVVEYQSAHIEPVESELVVRSAHSTQGNPHTIEEVRRILLEHAVNVGCSDAPGMSSVEPAVPLSRVPDDGKPDVR